MVDKKPIEIVCPRCGEKTMVICCDIRSGRAEGILYDFDFAFEETDCHHNFIDWEYRCPFCDANLEWALYKEETTLVTERLKKERYIDLFEGFWEKDQSQSKKGEE